MSPPLAACRYHAPLATTTRRLPRVSFAPALAFCTRRGRRVSTLTQTVAALGKPAAVQAVRFQPAAAPGIQPRRYKVAEVQNQVMLWHVERHSVVMEFPLNSYEQLVPCMSGSCTLAIILQFRGEEEDLWLLGKAKEITQSPKTAGACSSQITQ